MRKGLLIALLLVGMASFNGVCFAKDCDDSVKTNELTLGTVQKCIHAGMSQADVATILGSPNIVTKDSENKETWIYDKVSTDVKQSSGGGYFTLILLGFGRSHDNITSSQKTLTVVIKFNEKILVDSVNYNSSRF